MANLLETAPVSTVKWLLLKLAIPFTVAVAKSLVVIIVPPLVDKVKVWSVVKLSTPNKVILL